MTQVADIMTREVITVAPETLLRDLAEILSSKRINGVPVTDKDKKVIGVVCESDLVNQDKPLHIPTFFFILDSFIPMENPWRLEKEIKRITATKVEEICSTPAVTVTSDTDISEVARLMGEKKLYTIPVVDGGKLVGVVGKADVIRAVYG
jgi:CBS-domain-containing membrane protein